jgi:hypothetical protein
MTLSKGVSERAGKDKRIYLTKEKTGAIFAFLAAKNQRIWVKGGLRSH